MDHEQQESGKKNTETFSSTLLHSPLLASSLCPKIQ